MNKYEQSEQIWIFPHPVWNRQKFVLNNQPTAETTKDSKGTPGESCLDDGKNSFADHGGYTVGMVFHLMT